MADHLCGGLLLVGLSFAIAWLLALKNPKDQLLSVLETFGYLHVVPDLSYASGPPAFQGEYINHETKKRGNFAAFS